MIPQTFHWADFTVIAALVLLEGLLSGDNALVLAIIARRLPPEQRQKALLYGVVGAFALRFAAIALASFILKLWWIQAAGAIYLLYITGSHFASQANEKEVNSKAQGFWQTVLAIEMIDIAFAIDSVLAGVAFVAGKHDKIWLVWAGAAIGIVLLRIASGFFVSLLERFPVLDHLAYVLVGWVGVKLAMLAAHSAHTVHASTLAVPEMPEAVFWTGMAVVTVVGLWIVLTPGVGRSPLETTGPRDPE